MLSNFIVSLEAVFPMFAIMAIGALIRKAGLITPPEQKRFNRIVFICCFPAMMFINLYGKDIASAMNVKLIIYAVAVILILYAITVITVIRIEPSQKTRGAMIQAIYRSNFVIMGIPIVQNVFGRGELAMTAVVVTVIVPIFNILAVVTLEVFRGSKPNFKDILANLAKNPIILGAVAGIISIIFNIKLPAFIENPINLMGEAATPMTLLLLGASFNFESAAKEKRNLIICIVGRLIIFPLVGLTGAILMGFRGVALLTLVAMLAAPSAVTSYTMAQSMDSDYELAGNCVIFSSIFSCFTMFLWIFILKTMGMF